MKKIISLISLISILGLSCQRKHTWHIDIDIYAVYINPETMRKVFLYSEPETKFEGYLEYYKVHVYDFTKIATTKWIDHYCRTQTTSLENGDIHVTKATLVDTGE